MIQNVIIWGCVALNLGGAFYNWKQFLRARKINDEMENELKKLLVRSLRELATTPVVINMEPSNLFREKLH